jgi:hypothetical protein
MIKYLMLLLLIDAVIDALDAERSFNQRFVSMAVVIFCVAVLVPAAAVPVA